MMAEKVTEIEEATERSQALETRSIVSASTNRSRSSSASIAAAKARAKLEAARAKAEFLRKESEILIEKAQLKVTEAHMEASLSALKHESEVAAVLAEAKVLEAAAESELGERISDAREISDRTRDYVMHQSRLEFSPPVEDEQYQSPLEPIVHVLKPETPQRQHRLTAWDVSDSYNKPDTESMVQQPQRSVKFQAPPFTSSPCKTTPQSSFNNDANLAFCFLYVLCFGKALPKGVVEEVREEECRRRKHEERSLLNGRLKSPMTKRQVLKKAEGSSPKMTGSPRRQNHLTSVGSVE
ncbi:hypothetical protein HF521_018409 [Silurus meridionalis]|uniref:Uncharacterized protein n=1 Tax=Silurus meridionalis TaxID=175797 RepID=A0A8T0BIY3_SILME|nr:hypothetical protein HF521_018409 [Silurus meridionalis]